MKLLNILSYASLTLSMKFLKRDCIKNNTNMGLEISKRKFDLLVEKFDLKQDIDITLSRFEKHDGTEIKLKKDRYSLYFNTAGEFDHINLTDSKCVKVKDGKKYYNSIRYVK